MNAKDRQDEIDLLQRCYDAHGEFITLNRRLDDVETLLIADRDTEAEQVARDCWQRCQDIRTVFLRESYDEHVVSVLESVVACEDQALAWLELVRNKTPEWSAWRRAGQNANSQR